MNVNTQISVAAAEVTINICENGAELISAHQFCGCGEES